MSRGAAYLRLVRIPNVFTALGDPLAGAAVATWACLSVGAPVTPLWAGMVAWRGPLLCALAGGLIYLAGMAFNDVFDREEDLRDRPTRPIPAGEVSATAAATLGALLHAAGMWVAWSAAPAAGVGAAALVCATFLYNGVLKGGPLGPLAMGLCRSLNLLVGALATGWRPTPGAAAAGAAPLVAAVLMLAYVGAITRAAEGEVSGLDEAAAGRALERFTAVLVGGVALAATGALPAAPLALIPLLALFAALLRSATRMAQEPIGANVGGLVKASVFGIVMLDAALLLAAGAVTAGFATTLLLVPAALLGRTFHST